MNLVENLLNGPTWRLVEETNKRDDFFGEGSRIAALYDKELDLRKPDEAEVYFGDCAGKAVFVPLEPEQDENGHPIVELNCWYDENENEVWI